MSENKKRNKTDLEDSAQIWYFEMANPLWYILIICGMTYVSLLAYFPSVIPFNQLGTLGEFSKYLHTNYQLATILLFWLSWGAKIFEAIYVVKVAYDLGINATCLNLWFIQTTLVGYASTRLMRRYRAECYQSRKEQ